MRLLLLAVLLFGLSACVPTHQWVRDANPDPMSMDLAACRAEAYRTAVQFANTDPWYGIVVGKRLTAECMKGRGYSR